MTTIALLGDKDLNFVTHRELAAAVELFPVGVEAVWIPTDDEDSVERSAAADGLWLLPGTPYRHDDAVFEAITAARTRDQPFLGTCGGFQYAVVELARNLAGIESAAHAEVSPDAAMPVIERLSCSLVGEERKVTTEPRTILRSVLGAEPFIGFHYCNFGMAESYVEQLEAGGVRISARADDAGVEAIELLGHPFFCATLFQPQVGSIAGKPLNPLITAFLNAARDHHEK